MLPGATWTQADDGAELEMNVAFQSQAAHRSIHDNTDAYFPFPLRVGNQNFDCASRTADGRTVLSRRP
jgi:hypothetical protein